MHFRKSFFLKGSKLARLFVPHYVNLCMCRIHAVFSCKQLYKRNILQEVYIPNRLPASQQDPETNDREKFVS